MDELIAAVAVTAELTGTELSKAACRMLVEELSGYPTADVLTALSRCRRELRGKMSLADILDRLPNGRPGVEEAWALIRQVMSNEQASIVWTDEMRAAYGAAAPLADDLVAARMAFKEKYTALVSAARAERRPLSWSVSLGFDPNQRREAVEEATRRNLISQEQAQKLIPEISNAEAQSLVKQLMPSIGSKSL